MVAVMQHVDNLLVRTANSAIDDPYTAASSTAEAGRPFKTRAPSTHNTNAGPITVATMSQSPIAPRNSPAGRIPDLDEQRQRRGQHYRPHPLRAGDGWPVVRA